jgi:serine phosphatase RsbU (regulator of sigma subunit)
MIFNGYKNKLRINKQLQQQKGEIEIKNSQLEEIGKIINLQKDEISEKNTEIIDSITYAKRLQEAILPPQNMLRSFFNSSFILYKPKDIVAGDFYFFEAIKNETQKDITDLFIAVADCTGHGVPGAMVSVVCSNALNRAVKEFGLSDTGKILDKVTDLVIETFDKSETEVKDGMDISLLKIQIALEDSYKPVKIEWSGANNPLWFIENGELKEIKADKQPIGKYAERKQFTTHSISCKDSKSFYLFTDGYADQFGGEKGKKLKASKFKEIILAIKNDPAEDQKFFIEEAFNNWKEGYEQVDDVCIIGIRS